MTFLKAYCSDQLHSVHGFDCCWKIIIVSRARQCYSIHTHLVNFVFCSHLVGTSGMCQESDISSVDQCEELGVEDDVDLEVQRLLSVYDLVKDDESRDRLRKF